LSGVTARSGHPGPEHAGPERGPDHGTNQAPVSGPPDSHLIWQPDIEDWPEFRQPKVGVISKPFTMAEIHVKLAQFANRIIQDQLAIPIIGESNPES